MKPSGLTRILIIDDDQESRQIISHILNRHGFVTAEVSNGLEGLSEIDKFYFDAVVLDINLPDIHGTDVSRCIHNEYPIIMVSSNQEEDYLKEVDYSYETYIDKKKNITELPKAVDNAMRLWNLLVAA